VLPVTQQQCQITEGINRQKGKKNATGKICLIYKAHQTALIHDSSALSRTPAKAARQQTWAGTPIH